MGRNRVVTPEIVRLTLSDGDYIDIKRRLNTGEQNAIFARMAPEMVPGEKARLNTRSVATSRVVEYLVAWSFAQENGTPIPYTIDMPIEARLATLESLDPDDFKEVREAIDAHVAKVEKEIEERKNAQSGATA